MDVKVWQTDGGVRVVDVAEGMPLVKTLESVFIAGQNHNVPVEGRPSVSKGDIAELNGKFFACDSMGWTEVSESIVGFVKAVADHRLDDFRWRMSPAAFVKLVGEEDMSLVRIVANLHPLGKYAKTVVSAIETLLAIVAENSRLPCGG